MKALKIYNETTGLANVTVRHTKMERKMNKISSMLLGVCCLLLATNVFAGFNEKAMSCQGMACY